MSDLAFTPASLFGPLAVKVPNGPSTTLIPVAGFPGLLSGPRPTRGFVGTVRRFGVVVPVLVTEDPLGAVEFRGQRYTLLDGNRRVMAAREANIARVPARVLPVLENAEALTLALNGVRQDNPVTEYFAIKAFLGRGMSQSEIAKATGYPASKIRARLALDDLHEALFAALSDQRITSAVAEAAARLGPPTQARLVATLADTGKLTSADVRNVRQADVARVVAELPFGVFEPTMADPEAWRGLVHADLTHALAVVLALGSSQPVARVVARAIRRAMALVGGEGSEATTKAAS